jgi:hypothetical protein
LINQKVSEHFNEHESLIFLPVLSFESPYSTLLSSSSPSSFPGAFSVRTGTIRAWFRASGMFRKVFDAIDSSLDEFLKFLIF